MGLQNSIPEEGASLSEPGDFTQFYDITYFLKTQHKIPWYISDPGSFTEFPWQLF